MLHLPKIGFNWISRDLTTSIVKWQAVWNNWKKIKLLLSFLSLCVFFYYLIYSVHLLLILYSGITKPVFLSLNLQRRKYEDMIVTIDFSGFFFTGVRRILCDSRFREEEIGRKRDKCWWDWLLLLNSKTWAWGWEREQTSGQTSNIAL